jgi:hypothetical protein
MKKILLFIALFAIATMTTAQIKILTNGNVGIGTNNSDKGKVTISSNGSDFVFHAYNKTDGKAYFGMHNTNGDPWLNLYHPTEGYNKIRFKQSITSSDSTLKTNIRLLENATEILKQIKTYSYYFKSDSVYIRSDSLDERKREYGVLGQELQEIMPDLVDTCMETLFVNYNAFIAILIKGFNEQQATIETLQNIVLAQELDILQLKQLMKAFHELQDIVYECCKPKSMSPPLQIEEPLSEGETAILYQNIPNPFSSNTEISCYLPEATTQATLFIYNLQGAQLKEFSLTQTGMNTITVYGSELPAGMYLYTLVVNNEIIDTKRMILTK